MSETQSGGATGSCPEETIICEKCSSVIRDCTLKSCAYQHHLKMISGYCEECKIVPGGPETHDQIDRSQPIGTPETLAEYPPGSDPFRLAVKLKKFTDAELLAEIGRRRSLEGGHHG